MWAAVMDVIDNSAWNYKLSQSTTASTSRLGQWDHMQQIVIPMHESMPIFSYDVMQEIVAVVSHKRGDLGRFLVNW